MTKDEMRLVLMNNREDVLELMPSLREIQIMRMVERHKFAFSSDVSLWFDISLQNASTQLRKLHQKGYLSRMEITDPTGGTIFKYNMGVALMFIKKPLALVATSG